MLKKIILTNIFIINIFRRTNVNTNNVKVFTDVENKIKEVKEFQKKYINNSTPIDIVKEYVIAFTNKDKNTLDLLSGGYDVISYNFKNIWIKALFLLNSIEKYYIIKKDENKVLVKLEFNEKIKKVKNDYRFELVRNKNPYIKNGVWTLTRFIFDKEN